MAQFRFTAVTAAGTIVRGHRHAETRQALIEALLSESLTPVEARAGRGVPRLSWQSGGYSAGGAFLPRFVSRLASLVEADIPLDHALALARDTFKASGERKIIDMVRARIQSGDTLAKAMAAPEGIVPAYIRGLVAAAEQSGQLAEMLTRLGHELERARAIREQVVSAMIYPAFLVSLILATLVLVFTLVVPQFETLFEGIERVPPITALIFNTAHFVQRFWWLLPILVLAIWAVGRVALAREGVRLQRDRILMTSPVFLGLPEKIESARVCRTLGTLLAGGLSLVNGLRLARDVTQNLAVRGAIDAVITDVSEGQRLARALANRGLFSNEIRIFAGIGEETGRLGDMLLKGAQTLDAETATALSRLLALLVPLITIVMGAIVALVIAGVLLGILSLNEVTFQ